jgi:apolipoprotein D and lipocalin family protein
MFRIRPTSLPGFRAALTAALALFVAGCSVAPPDGVEPVRDFDADRYLGTWYEIARLDHRFERDLAEVTATYSKREDGGIAVRNRGYDVGAESWDSVEGRAYFTGEPDVGSLKVSFFGPFYGGYHVMALDEQAPDYGYALVSGPSTKYLWMLAREPELPEATIEMLVARAQDAGFPTDELIFVEHGVHGSAD